MWDYIKHWYNRKFSDPDAITLFLVLLIGFFTIVFFGAVLAPLLVAIALAYLLEWPVVHLMRLGVSRLSAVILVFLIFMSLGFGLIFFLIPVIWQQGLALIRELPEMIVSVQLLLNRLPEMFPGFVNEYQISQLIQSFKTRAISVGEGLIGQSLNSIVNLMGILIYLIVVPLLVLFMLKDRKILLSHLNRLLPRDRRLLSQVGSEMNLQIMNYIRGKALEVVIVGVATYLGFVAFDLRYAALLAVLVGLSVLIPYIGAVVVTIPVALVAVFQFGWSAMFAYVLVTYLIIQALDGNVLVPLLFSEAVSLNPVYIIGAVLFFGGLWGFWGVFFAIPLASLVKAVFTALSTPTPAQLPEQGAAETDA